MVYVPTTISVEVKMNDALDQISASDAIDYYGMDALLDEMDMDEIKSHFGWETAD